MPFGAFAEVVPGVDGLIHISQISDKRITKVEEALTIGDVVEAKIIEVDAEKQSIDMYCSMKVMHLLTKNNKL